MNNIEFYVLFTVLIILSISICFLFFREVNQSIEKFTLPNFIQIVPSGQGPTANNNLNSSPNTSGFAPLIVRFTPIYIDSFEPFVVDYGDTTQYIGETNQTFYHTYTNKGTFNGTITFNPLNVSKQTVQKFIITTL